MPARGTLVLALVLGIWSAVAASARATVPYSPKPAPLSTPWAGSVSTADPLPEYPRPQLQRSGWMNLNGLWQYEASGPGSPPPIGRALAKTILVPFPVGSALSGIERPDTAGWYRRTFQVPSRWGAQHVLLNFGAVSWAARVYVNGRLVGTHLGDYGGFSFDITRALHRGTTNELLVGYVDPIGAVGEPVGKQAARPPSGIFHSASSGIWQTVWLEPVAATHVTSLDLVPDLRHDRLLVRAQVTKGRGVKVQAQALSGRRVAGQATAPANHAFYLRLPRPRLWWPWHPYLYGLKLRLLSRGRMIDQVSSYFGMRSMTLGRVHGVTRLLLNGRFVFQSGALDQGMWPDGLYTPPSDAAVHFDLSAAKRLGYNMLREHQKVQPDRWYMWADRLGILVWQDMPSMPVTSPRRPTRAAEAEFRRELGSIVLQLRSHPSIVTWVPFNEGWQQFDLGGVTREIKRLDPAALVDTQSGSANCCDALESPASDMRDSHLYAGPFATAGDRRASVIGEYGGVLPFAPVADRWPGVQESLGSPAARWPLGYIVGVLRRQYAMLMQEMRTPGVSAAVFTEFADYEQELGIISYDRRVFTLPPALLRRLNTALIAASQQPGGATRQPPAVPPGASGIWHFDEGHGMLAADASGHRHPLLLDAAASWTRGVRGTALLLDRRGALAQTSGPVINTQRAFTVSAWLRLDRLAQSGSAVSQPGTDGSSFSLGIDSTGPSPQTRPGEISSGVLAPALRSWWTFRVPATWQCPAARCGVDANMHYDDGRLSPAPRRWHDVTGVYDPHTQTVSVYVDGLPEDVEHASPLPPATGPLTIGAGLLDYLPTDTFTGAIDELRTYARALTPAEAWQLYAAQRHR